MATKRTFIGRNVLVYITVVLTVILTTLLSPAPARAQGAACPPLPETYGRITFDTVNVTTAGEYNLWVRMRVKEANHKIQAQIGECAVKQMGVEGGATVNQWIWVNTTPTGQAVKATLAAGTTKLELAGDASSPNVDVDRILLVSGTCKPTLLGTNCVDDTPNPPPPPPPSGGGTKVGDINKDNKVDFLDLTLLMKNWHKPATAAQGDTDADGEITILDLSALITNWGQ